MRRLNIFVDETGEFGFDKGSSLLYGVSFTFHEQKDNIKEDINKLNDRLERIGYNGMIHTANLIAKRGDYEHFNISVRRSIFNAIYYFSKKIPVKYHTIIVDKRFINNNNQLRKKLKIEINKMISNNLKYFQKFSKVVLYYDNGQETLGKILNSEFNKFNNFKHCIDFDHKEKRLFQVCDMLTFIDKYDYKYKNKIDFTKNERYFFKKEEIKVMLKELDNKRFDRN